MSRKLRIQYPGAIYRVMKRRDHMELMKAPSEVRVWTEDVVLPTYLPAPPDKNPMFLEKRVYQGSSGRVYPLPFTDRIAEKPVDRKWTGGLDRERVSPRAGAAGDRRAHPRASRTRPTATTSSTASTVIKPALVGLAGPWISGGIEFNWPQHHRPATFLPVDFEIEEHADGSKTVWCSDHDPMARMKGMHGVCLHPGQRLPRTEGPRLQPHAASCRRSSGGPTSPRACTRPTRASSRRMSITWPTTRGAR